MSFFKFIKKPIILKRKGIFYELDLFDPLQLKIGCNLYERKELRRALALIKKGHIYMDVGANVGFYSLHFAKALQGLGKIYAFEPDPIVFNKLKKNCALNEFAKCVEPICSAVSNQNEKAPFYRTQDRCSGSGSLEKFEDINGPRTEVKKITLDNFVSEKCINHIELIKIDIEGHEIKLLEGAKNCLKNQVFANILIEFNGIRLAQKGHSCAQFLDALQTFGYRPHKHPLLQKIMRGKLDPHTVCTNFFFSREHLRI